MKSRRRNFSDDRLTITQCHTPSKNTSVNGATENSEESIPIDLIFEIVSRLPAKSVGKCRCVSNLWSSILHGLDFTELFLTRSRTRPQILFAVEKRKKVLFFSSPQPQNPDVNSSQVVCVNELLHFPFDDLFHMCGPVNGLVCLTDKRYIGIGSETVPVICNPTTGQSLLLPKVDTSRGRVTSYLGYDLVDKQFKVLCMTSFCGRKRVFDEYQILTIGGAGNNLSWRMIECCLPPHYSFDRGICIDGVLYYRASVDKSSNLCSMIVCFDVRSEKFSFITIAEDCIRVMRKGKLIDYNSKLGLLVCGTCGSYVAGFYGRSGGCVDGRNGRSGGNIELWVLEDAEKQEWSKRIYALPVMWQIILGIDILRFVGMTRTNEIVFSPNQCMPFCLVYYNIERNTITKVGIHGMEEVNSAAAVVYTFLDHFETYASV